MDFLKILFLLQNDRFMEITEAFHPQTPIATPMGVNNVDPDPTGGRGLLHEGRGNPPKRSPNCNGHPASSSIQVYRDGEISFIPLQERGIILHGKPVFISLYIHITVLCITGGPSKLQHQETPRETPKPPWGFPEGFLEE